MEWITAIDKRPCDRNVKDVELISARLRRVDTLTRLPNSLLQQLALCGYYEDLEKGVTYDRNELQKLQRAKHTKDDGKSKDNLGDDAPLTKEKLHRSAILSPINKQDFNKGDTDSDDDCIPEKESDAASDVSSTIDEVENNLQTSAVHSSRNESSIIFDVSPSANSQDYNQGDTDSDDDYIPEKESDAASDVSSTVDEMENNLQTSAVHSSRNESSIIFDVSASANSQGTTACDDRVMHVELSRGRSGDMKRNFCFYCCKKQGKIARHLELQHKNEEDVKKFTALPKNSLERRKIIAVIRRKGNYAFNTNENLNDGELIVARRPNAKLKRTACDFKACGNCKGYFAKSSLRVHFKNCTGISSKKNRIVMVMSKKVMGRIHSRATEAVRKQLFPPLREDEVVRLIRYDELVIVYANKMCDKYKNPRFYEMIRQRMRLLGRFLLTIKKLNNEVTDLASVYDPKYCDYTLRAINIEARLNEFTKSYEVPTTASSLGTLLKQVGNILINECIKKHDEDKRKNAKNFLKLLVQEVAISVNRTVVESQVEHRRRKKVELPSMEDIKKLHSYLSQKRNLAFQKLTSKFIYEDWMDLAELTLTSIQVFNRRRAGEVERILIDDFNTYQGIDENTDKDLFESLSLQSQETARKYVRFAIRGKLNRTVPVLLDIHLLECVKLILHYRRDAKVRDKNPYVFGIPGGSKEDHKYLRACILMRKFSAQCGATHPYRLRGTKLRKHIATTCISLNLSEHEVTDLANFMGHAEKIHKDIYRQPVLNREILRMSKLLETAQGANEDDNSEDDEIEERSGPVSRRTSKPVKERSMTHQDSKNVTKSFSNCMRKKRSSKLPQ